MNMNDFIEVLQEKNVPYAIDGDKISVNGNLDLRDTSITSLPDNLSVSCSLYLNGTNITSLSNGLRVGGSLDLCDTSITSLPKNLKVGGYLDLRYTGITRLPDNLNVGGSLFLYDTGISRLPDNLKVGGYLCLHPEKITNIAYRKFLRHGDNMVFAAWINGECCVVHNAQIFTLEEFYGKAPAEEVAQVAQECVDELKQRWKETGGSTTWINVSDSLPELDTPVLGCWFSDNGNFVLDCYVRTHSADAGGWVWAVAEDFGDGHWLFDDDYPIEFWMPLPGKPYLAGGAA